MCVRQIKKELRQFATEKRKKTNEWFFKTGQGEYGEHDRFMGIANPDVRKVAKKHKDCKLDDLQAIKQNTFLNVIGLVSIDYGMYFL